MKRLNFFIISLLLTGCAGQTTREVQITKEREIKNVVITPKEELLQSPCKAVPAGDTLIELAVNYNKNVKCIGLYQQQLIKLQNDVKEKELSHEQ